MNPDNKPADKNTYVDCDLCCKHIVEGREEALQCEGGCGLRFHRYCAGVSTSYFQELANSPAPLINSFVSLASSACRKP